ncbi:hypothetical protein ACF09Y_21995 [Streptomyces massasporeus]|uniref:hypothetical protein n=1 Tax=Streptomyces massasporeus TaxID=67324 RepID=UPI0036F61DD5
MNTENWIAVAAGVVAVVAASISFAQAAHAKAQSRAATEQVAVARQQLEQAEKVHREQNEPYVIVDIQPDGPGSGLLVLLVENIGPTLARDVKVTVDPPLTSASGDRMTERVQRGLARTIPMLPPGRRLKWAFDVSSQRFSSDLPTAFTFTVQSKGPFGDVEPLTYLVDISSWQETLLGEHPDAKVEKALGRIAGTVDALAGVYREVNAPTIRAREAEEELSSFLDDDASNS